MRSCVYFVQVGSRGPVKIGYTRLLKRRMNQLRVDNWQPITLLSFIPNATLADEQMLHRTFARDELRSEWFRKSKRMAALIDDINREAADAQLRESRELGGVDQRAVRRWVMSFNRQGVACDPGSSDTHQA